MFCSSCGNEMPDTEAKCPECGAKLRRRLIIFPLVTILLAFVVVIIGLLIFNHYKAISDINKTLEAAVARDSGYNETILKTEGESEGITTNEIIGLCEESIDYRTNIIIELRGLYPDMDNEIRNLLIEHLTAENEFYRQKIAFFRKQYSIISDIEKYYDLHKQQILRIYGGDLDGALMYNVYIEQSKEKIGEVVGELEDSGNRLLESYDSLLLREKELAEKMKSSGLHFIPVFEKLKEDHKKNVNEIILDSYHALEL